MQLEVIKCPCCGQAAPTAGIVRVSLEENRLWFEGHEVRLTGRLTELAYILALRMPETVRHGAIVAQMWGHSEGSFAETNMKVAVTQLRHALRPIGLDIINTWAIGYRMEVVAPVVSRTEGFSTVTGENHAQA